MDINILEQLYSKIGGKIATDGEKLFNTSVTDIEKALTYVLPALLGTLISGINNNEDAKRYKTYLDKNNYDGSIMDELEQAYNGGNFPSDLFDKGSRELNHLMEDKVEEFLNSVSEFSEIKVDKIRKISQFSIINLQTYIASLISSENLSPADIKMLLHNQSDTVTRQTPSKLYDTLNLHLTIEEESKKNTEKEKSHQSARETSTEVEEEEEFSLRKFSFQLLPQIGLLILTGFLIYFVSDLGYNSSYLNFVEDETTKTAYEERPLLSWGLPNGSIIAAPESSMIDGLINYLNTEKNDGDKSLLVNEKIYDSNSDTLNSTGHIIIKSLGKIMHAYPELKIRWDIYMPQNSKPIESKLGEYLKQALTDQAVASQRITWKVGIKKSIGGGRNYQIHCIARYKTDNKSKEKSESSKSSNPLNGIIK